jgi:hypothetical protein
MQEHRASFAFDTTELKEQLTELRGLLESRFPKGIPNEIVGQLASLSLDFVLSDNRSATIADGTVEIFNTLRLGLRFDDLRTALRTGKFEVHGENSKPTQLTLQSSRRDPQPGSDAVRQS